MMKPSHAFVLIVSAMLVVAGEGSAQKKVEPKPWKAFPTGWTLTTKAPVSCLMVNTGSRTAFVVRARCSEPVGRFSLASRKS